MNFVAVVEEYRRMSREDQFKLSFFDKKRMSLLDSYYELIRCIVNLKGDKSIKVFDRFVDLSINENMEFDFIIDDDGEVTSRGSIINPKLGHLFRVIETAMKKEGFLYIEVYNKNGYSEKGIYGVELGNLNWTPVEKELLKKKFMIGSSFLNIDKSVRNAVFKQLRKE